MYGMNIKNFWGSNRRCLNLFTWPQQMKVAVDLQSISSDCDGDEYNNQGAIQYTHEHENPSPLVKTILIKKNMQYEIFKILSQTKLNKLKNNILHRTTREKIDRMELIDLCFKKIQFLGKKSMTKELHLDDDVVLQMMDEFIECSSEVQTDNSIEQTAKYFFIEELEKIKDEKN